MGGAHRIWEGQGRPRTTVNGIISAKRDQTHVFSRFVVVVVVVVVVGILKI